MNRVSVIVGRFQVDELTIAHKELIQYALSQSDRLIIFVGVSPLKSSFNNPLTFGMRAIMISEYNTSYGNYNTPIIPIKDVFNVDLWSENLDNEIWRLLDLNEENVVTLYGGRDSFKYTGKYPKIEMDTILKSLSGTEVRERIGREIVYSQDFRKGVIWSPQNQFTTVLATVDICIFDKLTNSILMAKKPSDILYRFVGGFSDVNDETYEDAALREVKEETGLTVKNIRYIGSHRIKDGRYAKERNKIKTLFFVSQYDGGNPKANDDIAEVKWLRLSETIDSDIEEAHRPLFQMCKNYLVYGIGKDDIYR